MGEGFRIILYFCHIKGNAFMKRLYALAIVVFFLGLPLCAQQNVLKLAQKGDVQACLTLAKQDIKDYKFEEAGEWLEKAQTTLTKKKQKNVEIEQLREEVSRGFRMLQGTDQVLIIDSIVVDKAEFLQAYRLSEETGSLDSYAHFFTSVEDGSLYKTELGDRLYFGKRMEDGSKRICTSDQLGDGSWGTPHPISGISFEESEEDFPFLASDGATLYFASTGRPEGMGGYDIYVTRSSEGTNYLKPENLGMPYNSPFNDYMMVIDELNELGWFASDRYQPEGKVCIYVFVPNESRHPFNYDDDNPETIRQVALLRSIKYTQTDADALLKGKLHLKEAQLYRPETQVVREFELVVDDQHVYTSYIHFKNNQAAMLCKEWVAKRKELAELEQKLDESRLSYSNGKYNLASSIRAMEAQQETLSEEVHRMEKQVRKLELQ